MRPATAVEGRTAGADTLPWRSLLAAEPTGNYQVEVGSDAVQIGSNGVLAGLDDAVQTLATIRDLVDPEATGDVDPDVLVALLDRLHGLQAPLAATEAVVLQAINAADVPREQGAANAAAWLRHRYGLGGGQAKAKADRARLLRFLPQTTRRLAAGSLSVRQADVLVEAVKSPSYRGGDDVEDTLLPLADDRPDDVTFQRRVQGHTARRDADAIDREQREAFRRRGLRFVRHRDGMLGFAGRLHPTAGAGFEAAVAAMMTADPHDTPDELRRTVEQRRADALCDLVDTALRHGAPPSSGGVQPQVHVHVDYDEVADRAGRNPLDDPDDPDHPGNNGRTRHADGTWRNAGVLDGYGPLGPDAMARLLCDADICRIVRRGPSEILDVGRATRRWPTATRRAIIARDRHCRFPGCDRPASWCQAHHVHFWDLHDGETIVANGVLLCSFHHHLVHEGGWHLSLDPVTAEVTVTDRTGDTTLTSHTDRDPRGPAPPPGRHRPARPE